MIPTSIKKLDQILGGGIRDSLIIDIFGARGTGKTELAMQIAINSLLSGGKVFFQDTTGKFRPERMHKVIHERQLDVSLLENVLLEIKSNGNFNNQVGEDILDDEDISIINEELKKMGYIGQGDLKLPNIGLLII